MKKILYGLAALLLLASCGGGSSSSSSIYEEDSSAGTSGGTTTTTSVTASVSESVTYTVRVYVDGSATTYTVEEGSSFNEPSAPSVSSGYMFDGWYLDSGYSEKASFPMTITSDVNIYGRTLTNVEYFIVARDRTLATEYDYSDNLNVTTTLAFVSGPKGIRGGTVSKRDDSSLSYLAHYQSEGLLLIDGQTYVMHKDGQRIEVTLNEDGELSNYETGTIDGDEGSTFAKAIFEYEADDISDVAYDSSEGAYKLTTKANASSVISDTLGFLGSSLVQSIIENMPDVGSDFTMYVTYEDGYIKSYEYDFTVSVSVFGVTASLTFHYDLTFTNYEGGNISEPTIDGLYFNESDMNAQGLTALGSAISSYRSQSVSGYEFDMAFEIGYIDDSGSSDAYEATVSGETERALDGSDVYFFNEIDVDVAYGDDLDDSYQVRRANTADGYTYSATKGWFFYGDYEESAYRSEADDYFLLPDASFFSANNFAALQVTGTGKGTFILNGTGFSVLASLLNDHVYLEEDSNSVKLFGNSGLSNVDIKEAQVQYVLDGSSFDSLTIEVTGTADGLIGTQEFDGGEFTLTYLIEDSGITSYSIPSSESDL